jgi:hypothetical protein
MKKLSDYNLDIQFPAYIDSEMLMNRDEYSAFLIRKGYAYDPDASPAPVAIATPVIDSNVKESPLGDQNRTVADMFDALEAKAKADFVKRGRKSKKENA